MLPVHQKIQNAIAKARTVLLVMHIDPDGDAIGSLVAMGLALQQMEKSVTLACDSKVPGRFSYLPLSEQVQQGVPSDKTFDLMIALDCGDESRMGQIYTDLSEPKPFLINIDHHITNTTFGNVNLVDAKATSTTEVLYSLFRSLDVHITPEVALSLLTGLVTDTLGFRTVGVTPRTMQIASALMSAGADLELVTMQALNLKSFSLIKLWRTGLNNLRLEDGLIWTSINNTEREASGYNSSSTGGLVNLMANVEQAAMSAVLLEMEDGSVRVGFRCRPPYSVAELAANLGGGGHPLASGCALSGPLAEAEALVVRLSKEAIAEQQALESAYS